MKRRDHGAMEAVPMSAPCRAAAATQRRKDRVCKRSSSPASKIGRVDLIDHYSESTVVQTGRGEPNWSLGSTALLSWSGPVLADQNVHLLIAPPWLVRPLRVLLRAAARLAGVASVARRDRFDPHARAAECGGAARVRSGDDRVRCRRRRFRPTSCSNQLQKRLSESPKCAPNCVGIAEALVGANGDAITVVLDAQAIEASALPLPVSDSSLMLKSVKVDGAANEAVVARSGSLWLSVAARRASHRTDLRGVRRQGVAASSRSRRGACSST